MPTLQRPRLKPRQLVFAVDSTRTNRDTMEMESKGNKWERVILKISGEALADSNGFGIDNSKVQDVAEEIAVAVLMGVQVAVVVGGGNFFRGAKKEGVGLDRCSADYMGMLATVMNCLSLQAALESKGIPNVIQTAIEMKEIADSYNRRGAIKALEEGKVLIFGAGTGNPFFTTDTAAALRAAEIGAQVLLKATKVDGIYDKDPKKHPDAKLQTEITYEEVLHMRLEVMDTTAFTMCQENNIPVVVFDMMTAGNITAALRGKPIGSRVVTTRGQV